MVDIFFAESRYNKKIDFKNLITYLNENYKNKTIAVFSSIQFQSQIVNLMNNKSNTFKSITSQPLRTNYKGQILGCNSNKESLNLDTNTNLNININSILDVFVYIGDGNFHPYALAYAQEFEENLKPIIMFNPIDNGVKVFDIKNIEKNIKKRRGNLMRFHSSDNIGVFITIKKGQNQRALAMKLQLQKEYKDKNFYIFLGDNFDYNELDNFPYIECWVNTACPRIGQDDVLKINKPIVNINDVMK